jgi:hypothetical protein
MPRVVIQAVETNTVLAPGDYPARIVKGAAGIQAGGKHNGAEKVEVWFRIAEQNTVRETILWVPSMMWKVNKFAVACGYGKEGDDVIIKDEITDKNGSKRMINRITEFKPGTGKVDDFLADDEP